MLNKDLFNENGHLKESAFLLEEQGMLTDEESYLFLCHIESCDECGGKYLELLSASELTEPPPELSDNIMAEIGKINEKRSDKKILAVQFVKLAVAVCLTMVLFFGGVSDGIVKLSKEQIMPYFTATKNERPSPPKTENPKEEAFRGLGSNFGKRFNEVADLINNSFREDANNERKSTTNI